MTITKDKHLHSTAGATNGDMLGVPEAASELGIPIGTLRYWIHLRRIPSYKLGRHRKLRRSDIEAFIERHREGAV